jgi:hypothetical protein
MTGSAFCKFALGSRLRSDNISELYCCERAVVEIKIGEIAVKKTFATTLCILVISCLALAQAKAPKANTPRTHQNISTGAGISCGADPILPTDGSSTDDFVFQGSANWYLVNLKGGHSYSVEVWDSTDPTIGGSAQLAMIANDCTTPLPTANVSSLDPDLSGSFGQRISWIQTADAQAYVQLNTSDPSGNAYTIRVTDTTLWNQRWSTFSGFRTQYSFVNTTESPITGTLTVYNTTGTVVNTQIITISPLNDSFYIFSTPLNTVGFATFAFVGPAGAITSDAYFINGNATVIVPTAFAPRNYQH